MALSWKHLFQSAKSDGTDPTQVQPSQWNADHDFKMDTANVLGRATAGNGAIEQIPCTAQGRTFLSAADIATLIAAGIPLFSTGDVKFTIKTAADPGWLLCADGTIGNDTSGATQLASTALAAALFQLVYTVVPNTWAPIQDSTGATTTRGAGYAADFAASKRLPLTKLLGRAIAIAGGGSGLTSRAIGQFLGEETHALSIAEMPTHDHGGGNHNHTFALAQHVGNPAQAGGSGAFFSGYGTGTTDPSGAIIAAQGGATAHNTMQPTSFLNAMIKL